MHYLYELQVGAEHVSNASCVIELFRQISGKSHTTDPLGAFAMGIFFFNLASSAGAPFVERGARLALIKMIVNMSLNICCGMCCLFATLL